MSDVTTELAMEANDKAMEIARLKAENDRLREERDMYRDLVDCMVHPDIPDQLAAENAKLREQVERLRTQLADMTESVGRVEERCAKTFEVGKRWMAKAARFEAENAKLRELCEDMWNEGMCECGSRGKCARCEYGYPDRMRELGVEVDA